MSSTGRLFELDPVDADQEAPVRAPVEGQIVRVLPDVSGLDKEFDYVLPAALTDPVPVGTQVRIELNGRNVGGWITAVGLDQPGRFDVRPITRVRSAGPAPDVVELARWAAHRWSGRLGTLLKTASPPRVVPTPLAISPPARTEDHHPHEVVVVRDGPAVDVLARLVDAASLGNVLVVAPRVDQARSLAGRLRQRGVAVRSHPRDWAAGASRGGFVVGARSAVWASVPDLSLIVVLDEHDEALQEERHPTWHAREVAIERARRADIPCWLLSPSPSLAARSAADRIEVPTRSEERRGWPIIDVIDRRDDEPGRSGLFSSRAVKLFRTPGPVLAVLNRKGRAAMLACATCGELALTEDGNRLMVERDGTLICLATGETRPLICANCGATRLKRLRLGVTRAAEELSALLGEPVSELTADTDPQRPPTRVVVGTEAALHQLLHVDCVVFLDLDQELLAPRYRAAEQAMALVVRAARLVGGREDGGRIGLQTRTTDHRVIDAVLRADPDRLAVPEAELRESMGFPPFGALAELTGAGAPALAGALLAADTDGITVLGPRDDGRYLVRAPDPDRLADVLAAVDRPSDRVRVVVDPPRV